MRKFLLFFGILFFIQGIIAQRSNYSDSVDFLYDKAESHFFTNQDSAYFYYEKVNELATVKQEWIDVIDAVVSSNRVASYHNDFNRMKSFLKDLDSLMLSKKSYLDSLSQLAMYKTYHNFEKGNFFFLLNDFQKSRKFFLKIIDQIEKLPQSDRNEEQISYLATSYNYLAKMMIDEGKYDLARMYCNKNIRFLGEVNGEEYLKNDALNLLSEVYKLEKKFALANGILLKTIETNQEEKSEITILSILNIVQNHNKLSQLDSAQYYLRIANSLLDDNDPFKSSYYQVSAETFQSKGDYTKSIQEFKKALQLVQQKWQNKKHWEVAHVFNKIGLLHSRFEQPQKAIESYDLALEQISNSNTARDQSKMVQILKNKARALNKIKSESEYKECVRTVDFGIALLDSLKPNFKNHQDKLYLIEEAFPLFESGIEAVSNLYQSSQDDKYIETAFNYSEESKAVLLLEALLGAKATKFANIPYALVERESQLKSEITFAEKKLNTAKTTTGKLKDNLFDLKEKYRQMVDTIETNYKTYYNLKYNTSIISLVEMQQELEPNEKLISYFYGNNAIYAIAVSKNGKQLEKIPIDNLFETKVREVHRMLADSKSDITVLSKATHQLYLKLLEPLLEPNINKLTIITDGLLNYIPFSALNTTPEGLDYLAARCAVSYSNSATLLSELQLRKPKTPNVLALAPSFNGSSEVNISRSSLMPLPHNKPEVAKVLTAFDGRSLLDKEASLQNFKKEFDKFGIIHLATHAVFNDSTPEYSYLAFSQNENNDNEDLLFVADLYNIKTDADLVTLSACESGIGELRRGEGFMGLSRGFFYSGAASIASTLWKINDASSADLMGLFYSNLAKGDPKDKALRKAQKAFLKTNSQNALAHPYYWSGFVISGNIAPLKSSTSWGYWAIGAVLIGAGIWTFRRKKRAAA